MALCEDRRRIDLARNNRLLRRVGTIGVNIVFDLGGVVFAWQPESIISSVFDDASTRAVVHKEIFEHADWVSLDRGTLSFEDAVERGASRTGLAPQEIERLLNAVPPSLVPIQATWDLIGDLRKTKSKLFVLSNMQFASIAYLEEKHAIWKHFDGVVISARIQLVKPEIAIYKHLLTEYRLDAADTVFIDDMPDNLEAAASTGIRTIRFLSADQCRRDLREHFGVDFNARN